MKVRKEHFLLPKGKNISTGTPKWIQSNKGLNCTSISSQATIEGLPSALITNVKSDVLLSNGEIIVSGHSGGPLILQQQDGILRQALISTEKDVKSEEKINESINVDACQTQNETCVISAGNTGLLSITAMTPQQLTPITTSQVIKMNDYQVILSSEALPVTWQDSGNNNNALSMSSLPPIKPKTDTGFVISDKQMTFSSIGNISVVGQNQFSTIVIKDRNSSLPGNLTLNNSRLNQIATPKKALNKITSKTLKTKKKPIQTKKIMIKPASSLLSQTALDYRNKDRIESLGEKVCEATSLPVSNTTLERKLSFSDKTGIDYTIENPVEPVALVTSSALPVSTSNLIITTHDNIHSFNSKLKSKLSASNLPLTNFTEKNTYSQSLSTVKTTENNINYDLSSVNLIGESVTESSILLTSNSCISAHDQSLTLNNTSVIGENVLIDSNTKVICSDGQSALLHSSVLANNNCNVPNTCQPDVRNEDSYRDHAETILPLDIEHHEEHHTQEYTDNLLSQLSNSRVLPNMSSSQVSSVLNSLVTSDKIDVTGLAAINNSKPIKESVKCEPTEFVKIETLQIPNIKLKTKSSEPKYRICELNKHTCFRCVNCMFLSLKTESVEKHWVEEHQSLRSDQLDKQLTKKAIKCLGCTNVFYSKYALQIHLLCDHNVITIEVHDIIAATLSANKGQRESKRQLAAKSALTKAKITPQQVESSKIIPIDMPLSLTTTAYQPNINSVITQSLTQLPVSTPSPFVETTSVIMSEPAKVDEQKHMSDDVTEIPPTPNFTLFSEIQLHSDKEEIVITDYPSGEDNNKKVVPSKRPRSPHRCRTTRSKMKPEFGSEIKFNYRCVVERCGVRVSSVVNLNYHMRCHKSDSDMLFCPECEYSVVNWNSLTPHLWREHKIDMDLYSCKHCNYKSNSYSKLINNHVKIHGDERPFLCDLCGKGFKTTKQLRNHKAIHRTRRKNVSSGGNPQSEEAENSSEFVCTVCSRTFADSRVLKHHTENVHNKARPYRCTFCIHTASSKSSLRMHIRQHTGEKPFSCNECEYVTSDHNSLRRHKMRHSGRRPYQCPHCIYNCIQATTYKSHLKNKHPGLDEGLMFSCPMCPFRTVKKDNYLTHKAEHDLGGDPRSRRKKLTSTEVVQENSLTLHNTTTYIPEQDVVVLLAHSNDLHSVEGDNIELIVPETSSV